MARTYRAHLSPGQRAKRGGRAKSEGRTLKTHKQRRPNARIRIRKENLL